MATTTSSDGNVVGVVWRSSASGGEAVVGVTQSGTVEVISRTVLGGAAASVDLTSIPQTYESLELHVLCRGDTAAASVNLKVRFNGDTGANYDSEILYGSGASSAGFQATAQTSCGVEDFPAASATAAKAGIGRMLIPGYARTTFHKVMLNSGGRWQTEAANGGTTEHGLFTWRSAAAINQVTLFPAAGNFVAGTVVTLYGIKGA